ncbi:MULTISPECIES: hypothetical protein [unclassified Corallococcus]|uniref:hypothetical protein n=1 Tax=unclassified Corallococcus TaxID=2685029 RepID=UPI001A8F463C|nr:MULTISPECIES: hypothetical protein [unclassified Corallococcus]MBN9685171.1 hypothetical protein [Corallococcus sp. NCSPR001]WAS83371.1 hypothetical protein O0N60_29160 [Corallococcus sp. NCRR]
MKKRLTLAACLAVVLSAPVALAQASTGASSSILDALLTPTNITLALGLVAGAVGLFAVGTWLTEQRKRRIALGAYHAFHVVEDIAAEDPEENLVDKAAKGLEVIDTWMKANGWRPLKPGEQALAKLQFSALYGEQKAEEKVQAQALSVALGAIGSTAGLPPALTAVASVPTTPRG